MRRMHACMRTCPCMRMVNCNVATFTNNTLAMAWSQPSSQADPLPRQHMWVGGKLDQALYLRLYALASPASAQRVVRVPPQGVFGTTYNVFQLQRQAACAAIQDPE